MKNIRTLLALVLLTMVSSAVHAQNQPVEMADKMRENGMIYVVVGVILIIFAGLIGYLVTLDRKIKNLETQTNA